MKVVEGVQIKGCARCGQDHMVLRFMELQRPHEEFTHWCPCPVTDEPIMMRIVSDTGKVSEHQMVETVSGPKLDFMVVWDKDEPNEDHQSYRATFKVFEIIGRYTDGTIIFQKAGAPTSPTPVESALEAEVYMTGFVKWDGCMEIDAEHRHFCGPEGGLKQHAAIQKYLYERAFKIMNRMVYETYGRELQCERVRYLDKIP